MSVEAKTGHGTVMNSMEIDNQYPLSMKPGEISRDGFLGADRRSPEEIIRADDDVAKHLNLTHRDIAARMKELRKKGLKGLGGLVSVAPHFEVSCDIARGFLPCPFGEPGLHRKTTVTVRNLRIRKAIAFSDLNIHLIEAHGFYEGKKSPFRLEPAELARVLEIGDAKN